MAKVIAYLNNLRSRLMRRSASGPTNLTGEEGKLRNTAAINSRRARRYARVIVGGLLFEVIILLVYSAQKSWHETAFLIISALIIAAGVWGEDRHAHEADSANNELQRISDEKIAEANVRAAEAQLRAEQLRRAMSWRQLNDEEFLEELGRAREKATVELLYVDDDPESFHFAVDLQIRIGSAGWPITSPKAVRYKLKDGGLLLPAYLGEQQIDGINPIGVTIGTHSLEEGSKDGTAFKALECALLTSIDSVFGARADRVSPERLLVVVAPRA